VELEHQFLKPERQRKLGIGLVFQIYNYHGLFIEIKTEKGRATKSQKEWIKALNERGYKAVICKGFEECKKEIDKYLR
jgi:hypothetical protein